LASHAAPRPATAVTASAELVTPTAAAAPLPTAHIGHGVARLAAKHRQRIDDEVHGAIRAGACPGAVVALVRDGNTVFRKAYGEHSVRPRRRAMAADAIFDMASLTKPIVTATAVMQLVEAGELALTDPVSKHLRAFGQRGKASLTIAQLLTHTSGLAAANHLKHYRRGKQRALDAIFALAPTDRPGKRAYSDLGYIVLGAVIEKVTGESLASYARTRIFEPLGMISSTFGPAPGAVPTEQRDGDWLAGTVHDPRAAGLGGIAGHAGLFSTVDDIARFARMLLAGGVLDGRRVLSQASVATLRTHGFHRAGHGYGHTGFTGTSLWLDPKRHLALVILTSRLHPDGRGDVRALRRDLRRLVIEAASDKPEVMTGIDVLRANGFAQLRGARVGLITNHTGRANDGRRTATLLHRAPKVELVALFSPEHGLAGTRDTAVKDGLDSDTGKPVYSLYGKRKRPSAEQLRGIDTLVFDVQGAGARFYTYATTLGYALEAATAANIRLVVLDRPNPIDGVHMEGPLLEDARRSFIGYHTIPVRHGMTMGELAQLFNAERQIGAELEVVPMRGWRRAMRFDDTGLSWVDPSPNLRSGRAALLYPGVALLEATNVSVGRGTDTPFEHIGAPWIDAHGLSAALSKLGITGVEITATRFTPRSSKHAGVSCNGVAFRITDPARMSPLRLGVALAQQLSILHPGRWQPDGVLTLLGNRKTFDTLLSGADVDTVMATWRQPVAAFAKRRAPHLLYR